MENRHHRAMLLFPQPDPLLRYSDYRSILLEQLAEEVGTPLIELPTNVSEKSVPFEWSAPYHVYQLKNHPHLTLWEPQPRHTYVRDWKAHIPFPLISAIIPLCDPKFTSSNLKIDYKSNEDSLRNLLEGQKKILDLLLEDLKENYNIPIILVYVKRWPDSPKVEDVVSSSWLSNTHILSYQLEDVSNLLVDLITTLSNEKVSKHTLTSGSELKNPSILKSFNWGVAKKTPEQFVIDLATAIHSQNETITIWVDSGELPINEAEDVLNSQDFHILYDDLTIAVPTIGNDRRIAAAYFPYVEWHGATYSSFESLEGNIAIDDFQSNLRSAWRIAQSITPGMRKDELQTILNRMIALAIYRE